MKLARVSQSVIKESVGEDDFDAGLRTLASWAAEATPELGDRLYAVYLSSISLRIRQSPEA